MPGCSSSILVPLEIQSRRIFSCKKKKTSGVRCEVIFNQTILLLPLHLVTWWNPIASSVVPLQAAEGRTGGWGPERAVQMFLLFTINTDGEQHRVPIVLNGSRAESKYCGYTLSRSIRVNTEAECRWWPSLTHTRWCRNRSTTPNSASLWSVCVCVEIQHSVHNQSFIVQQLGSISHMVSVTGLDGLLATIRPTFYSIHPMHISMYLMDEEKKHARN